MACTSAAISPPQSSLGELLLLAGSGIGDRQL
jgi:hypothetical protein